MAFQLICSLWLMLSRQEPFREPIAPSDKVCVTGAHTEPV